MGTLTLSPMQKSYISQAKRQRSAQRRKAAARERPRTASWMPRSLGASPTATTLYGMANDDGDVPRAAALSGQALRRSLSHTGATKSRSLVVSPLKGSKSSGAMLFGKSMARTAGSAASGGADSGAADAYAAYLASGGGRGDDSRPGTSSGRPFTVGKLLSRG